MDQPLLRQPVEWVLDDQSLASFCKEWHLARLLAVDTEFMRVDTYYPKAALIQINDGKCNYLIDPLQITDWQPLADVLTAPAVIKAFHANSEDLDVFYHLLGVLPSPLFDTQIAGALVGLGNGVGYGNLVASVLSVQLPKGETRSNWLARPLTPAQALYAALDVDYLYELAHLLEEKLAELGRESWLYEEGEAAKENYLSNLDPAAGFYKSNNTWRLSADALVRAKLLFEWRELKARKVNIPKSRLFKDAVLFELCRKPINSLPQLKAAGLVDSVIRKYGRELIDYLGSEYATTPTLNASARPLTKEQRERTKAIKLKVEQLAQEKHIAPEILVRKAEYHELARQTPEEMDDFAAIAQVTTGWRQYFFKTCHE